MNSEKYLNECLISVETQLVFPSSHIFIDGYSTDSTTAIINDYKKRNIGNFDVQLYLTQPKGIANAMNFAITKIQNGFVWFLHSDDRISNTSVIKQLESSIDSTSKRWIVGDCNTIDENGVKVDTFVSPEKNHNKLLRFNSIPHPSALVHIDLLKKYNGFDETYYYAMDYDLWLRLAKSNYPDFLDYPLADFRNHDGSLSSRRKWQTHIEDFKVRNRHTRGLRNLTLNIIFFAVNFIFISVPKLKLVYQKIKN